MDQLMPYTSGRRAILKAAAIAGVTQVAAPFVISARAADTIKIGLDDPFTGTYAELGKNEQIGCELAIEQINAKGGILDRKIELVAEDFTSADTGTAVQKAHKLIDRDKVDFLLGNVNSAMAIALGEVSNAAGDPAHRHRRPHRFGDRHGLPLERVPRLQHNADGDQFGLRDAVQEVWQEVVFPDARLCVRPYPAAGLRGGAEGISRHRGRRVADAARHDRLLVVSHQGAGGQPGRHHLPAGRTGRRQRAEAGGAIRPRQAVPYRRRAAGA